MNNNVLYSLSRKTLRNLLNEYRKTEYYWEINAVYLSKKYSIRKLQSKLDYYIEKNNVTGINFYNRILRVKRKLLTYNIDNISDISNVDRLNMLLKEKDLAIFFLVGEKYLYAMYKGGLEKISLKLNTVNPPRIMTDTEYEKTHQYKNLIELGFKPKGHHCWEYKNEKITLWVSMDLGKIHKLKVNDFLCKKFKFIPHKQLVRLNIRKGLTCDDRKLMKKF